MSITIEELTNTINNAVSLGSSTKFNSDTSTFQTQIDNKIAPITNGSLTSVLSNNLTPSKILVSDNNGKLSTSTIDSSKLLFLKDITSNVQGQLNSKQSTINGSINSILNSNFVPGKAIITNNTGELESSTLDTTQLDFLSNISTDLQTNIDFLLISSNNLNTLCINSNNEIKKWNYPSNIISITSLSSLPTTIIFVKDKMCSVRLKMDNDLYTTNISDLISEIIITPQGESAINLNLLSSGIVIDINNSTIDFNYQATSEVQHDITIKLKSPNILNLGVTIYTCNISVLQSNIFSFPLTLTSTTKNSPYDISDITVGETITMTSTFSEALNSSIIPNIVINDTSSNLLIISSNISGSDVIYSFTIANDADHSGTITLHLGDVSHNYNWATGLLTANSHIYQFSNYFSVTGTIRGLESNPIILTFSGGDNLHSTTIDSQIEYIKWHQGSGDQTISSSNLTIDTTNNTITINSFTPPEWTIDLTFKIKLRGPDWTISNSVLSSEITSIVSASNILTGNTYYVHEPGYYYEVQPNSSGVRATFMDASNTTRAMTICFWIRIPADSKYYRLTSDSATSWTLYGLTSDMFGYTGGTNAPISNGLPFISGVQTSVVDPVYGSIYNAKNRRFVNMFGANNWNYNHGRDAFSHNSTAVISTWYSVPYGMGMGSGYYNTSQQYSDWRADIYNRGSAPALAFNDWAFIGFKVGSNNRFVQFIGDKNNPVLEGASTPGKWNHFTHDGNLYGVPASNEIGDILNFSPQHWSYTNYSTTADLHIEDLIVIHDELTLTELDNIRLNGISSDAPGVAAHWFKRGSLNDASPTGSNLLKKQSTNKSNSLVTVPT
tara:strand:+ start:3419 stop:5935 length:2517 start_codon:yes stop_codon:yes gene_type:complete